jgi:hypothetical protein
VQGRGCAYFVFTTLPFCPFEMQQFEREHLSENFDFQQICLKKNYNFKIKKIIILHRALDYNPVEVL